MKTKSRAIVAVVAIVAVSVVMWNWSFEISRALGMSHHVVDMCAAFVGLLAVGPSSRYSEARKEERKQQQVIG